MLTVQSGRLENRGTEPSTFPVGNTRETVAASRGLEAVGLAPGARDIVVAGTSASPIAEHCALVMLRIPSQLDLKLRGGQMRVQLTVLIVYATSLKFTESCFTASESRINANAIPIGWLAATL